MNREILITIKQKIESTCAITIITITKLGGRMGMRIFLILIRDKIEV